MSEADNVWRVDVEAVPHEIEVDHNTMTGRITVLVDGTQVAAGRMIFRQKDLELPLGAHRAVVSVAFANLGFGARSELHLDGRYVEPLRR